MKSRMARVRIWLAQLAALTVKECVLLLRDPLFLVLLILCFTVTVHSTASGDARNELRNAAFVVIDHDHTTRSRELIDRLRPPYFRGGAAVASGRAGVQALDDGTAMIALDIAEGFGRDLDRGGAPRVQMQIDATNAILAQLASGYGSQIIRSAGAATCAMPVVDNRVREWYAIGYGDQVSKAIKAIGPLILLFAMLLPASAMAREKERGTIEQMLVSPVTPLQVMLSKVLPMAALICAASALTLFVVIHRWLGMPTRGSSGVFLAITGLYAFNICGIGLLISTFTRSIGQVGLVSMLIMPPLLLLSGVYSPPEGMPPLLRPLTNLSPLYHYQNAAFGVLLKDASIREILLSVTAMAALGTAIFLFGVRQFRRQYR